MSKKAKLLKTLLGSMLKQIGSKQNIPEEKMEEIESEIDHNLARKLGNNWATLPATGPYLMAFFIVLNYTLGPMGITPATITDSILDKSKEYGMDEKFNELVTSAKSTIKSTGEISNEKIKEFSQYINETSKTIGDSFNETFGDGLEFTKGLFEGGFNFGKGMVEGIFKKKDKE